MRWLQLRQKAEQLLASHQKATLDDDGTFEPQVPDITMEVEEMKRLQEQDTSLTSLRSSRVRGKGEYVLQERGEGGPIVQMVDTCRTRRRKRDCTVNIAREMQKGL